MPKSTERQCRKHGLDWTKPSRFPRLGVTPLRIALVGLEEPWLGAFRRKVMELNFVRDEEINDPTRLSAVLSELGLPAAEILAAAQSEPIKTRLRELTDEARAKGVFGAPTFFVGGEMFWGNDRLDDALAFAVANRGRTRALGRTRAKRLAITKEARRVDEGRSQVIRGHSLIASVSEAKRTPLK